MTGVDVDGEEMKFKFVWLNEKGQQTSMLRKKGRLTGEELVLDDVTVPVTAIGQVICRDQRMVLSVATHDPESPVVTLLISLTSKKVADGLKLKIDRLRSTAWARAKRRLMDEQGQSHRYREQVCPHCDAVIELTDQPATPQTYCDFCDTLTTHAVDQDASSVEATLRICEECGMYSNPRKFTIFYFYFAVVFYGVWTRPTWRCAACMRKDAWKMLFGNAPFLLGVPVALTQLSRCYGSPLLNGSYKGLDTGNIRARKGNLGGALQLYRSILERTPHSAGVKYNLGMALLTQGDKQRAADTFELCLEDCANYSPAYQRLSELYTELGQTDRLQDLRRRWGQVEDDLREAAEPDVVLLDD